MKKDTSRDIYTTFYNSGNRLLRVTLVNGQVHEGWFIGFFHGDEESGEPYITRWHFLQKDEKTPLRSIIDPTQVQGIYIDHERIRTVEFC